VLRGVPAARVPRIIPPVVPPPVVAPPIVAPPIVAAPIVAAPAIPAEPAPGAETAIFTKWLEDDSSFAAPAGETAGFERDESVPVHHRAPARWRMVLALEVLAVLAVLVGVVVLALRRG
jgi:hypothetical protein